jgi:hypothetical protein
LHPDKVRFSMARSTESSVYLIQEIGTYPIYIKGLDWDRTNLVDQN